MKKYTTLLLTFALVMAVPAVAMNKDAAVSKNEAATVAEIRAKLANAKAEAIRKQEQSTWNKAAKLAKSARAGASGLKKTVCDKSVQLTESTGNAVKSVQSNLKLGALATLHTVKNHPKTVALATATAALATATAAYLYAPEQIVEQIVDSVRNDFTLDMCQKGMETSSEYLAEQAQVVAEGYNDLVLYLRAFARFGI